MPRYAVTARVVYHDVLIVEAGSAEEAKEMVNDPDFEFQYAIAVYNDADPRIEFAMDVEEESEDE